MHLAELDRLRCVEVPCGLQHDEGHVTEALQLGPLLERVLDGEGVQIEQHRHVAHLGLGRAIQADPGHALLRPRLRDRLGRRPSGHSGSLHVHGGIHERHVPHTKAAPPRRRVDTGG
jgi:hypothetical protein